MTVRKHFIPSKSRALMAFVVAALVAAGLSMLGSTGAQASTNVKTLEIKVAVAETVARACSTDADFAPASRLGHNGKSGTVKVRWLQTCGAGDMMVTAKVAGSSKLYTLGTAPNDGKWHVLPLPVQPAGSSRYMAVSGESADTTIQGIQFWVKAGVVTKVIKGTNEESPKSKLFFAVTDVEGLADEYDLIHVGNTRLVVQNTGGVLGSRTIIVAPMAALADSFRPAWRKAIIRTYANGGTGSRVFVYTKSKPTKVTVTVGAKRGE